MLRDGRIRYERKLIELCDIAIHPGEIVGLSGPSGCGKSSLARVLAGIQRLESGKLDAPKYSRGEANPVQWVIQQPEFAFNPYLTLRQSLKESWQDKSYQPLLDAYMISENWLDRRPGQLSGGQLQRLNLIRALVPSTRYLLCDEATAQLDLLTQRHLWQSLIPYCVQQEIGVLVISHDLTLLEALCDRQVQL
ncbi:ATP-binding cassette domain-containing protein [Parasalinivibrio latis]|uniref:ATP-binding cassette domain-containing protein n=1 Tax=Parasalinivibrio latis TaxID=2952610 RepID=UPI0030E01D36